jgi:hypothetical protein
MRAVSDARLCRHDDADLSAPVSLVGLAGGESCARVAAFPGDAGR